MAGVSATHMEQFEVAREHLEKAIKLTGDEDADVVSMLGNTYAELSKRKNEKFYKDRAVQLLTKAQSLCKMEGLPATLPGLAAAAMANVATDFLAKRDTAPRMWLIKVSQRRYAELQNTHPRELKRIVKPMGAAARPGDICFFAAEAPRLSATQERSWRICGVYAVASEPIWNPLTRYQTALQLISIPPEPIPVDVHLLDSSDEVDTSRLERDHPVRYGVFELEDSALDIITEAIAQRRQAGRDLGSFGEELERLRHTS